MVLPEGDIGLRWPEQQEVANLLKLEKAEKEIRRLRADISICEHRLEKPGRVFPGVGTGCVVWSEGHLLLLKRQGSHGEGQWAVPGGWLEFGEDPCEGARRELLEETGLDLEPMSQIGFTSTVHEEGIHAVTLWVVMTPVDDRPELTILEPTKCSKIKWVHPDKIYKKNLFGGLREMMETIMEWENW